MVEFESSWVIIKSDILEMRVFLSTLMHMYVCM